MEGSLVFPEQEIPKQASSRNHEASQHVFKDNSQWLEIQVQGLDPCWKARVAEQGSSRAEDFIHESL